MKEVRDALDPDRPTTMQELSRKLRKPDASLRRVLNALRDIGVVEHVDLPSDVPYHRRSMKGRGPTVGWVKRNI